MARTVLPVEGDTPGAGGLPVAPPARGEGGVVHRADGPADGDRVDVGAVLRSPWLLAPIGLAWAILATAQQQRAGRPWTFLVSDIVPGLVLLAVGLLIRARRSQNRCWYLIVGAGFAWYVGDFEHAAVDDVVLAGFVLGRWHTVLLAWAVLAFPSGRLQARHDRVLVGALVALFGVRTMARLLLYVPPDLGGYGTANRFLPISDDRWWRAVEDAFAWGISAAVLVLLVSVAHRLIDVSGPGRRVLWPALFAAAVLAAAVI